ncbi:MAG: hypothetical protein U0230_20010 [Polyangiales bacterium]
MTGWETVLAAVGGTLVGLGLGITIGRRGEERIRLERAQVDAQLGNSVIPVLVHRAEQLSLPVRPIARDDDPVEVAVELATSIQRFDETKNLPFSDTVDVSRSSLSPDKTRGAP